MQTPKTSWVSIATFSNEQEAAVAEMLLKSYDIEAVMVNKKDSAYLFGSIELHVSEMDKKTAEAVLLTLNKT